MEFLQHKSDLVPTHMPIEWRFFLHSKKKKLLVTLRSKKQIFRNPTKKDEMAPLQRKYTSEDDLVQDSTRSSSECMF